MVFYTLPQLSDVLFCTIILLVCTGISVHICVGNGTRIGKQYLLGTFSAIICAVQLYHLINAALYVPATKHFIYKVLKKYEQKSLSHLLLTFRISCIVPIASGALKVLLDSFLTASHNNFYLRWKTAG